MKNLHTRKTSNESNSDWVIQQMSISQKSGWQTFCRRFVPGSLFVLPCPPECNFQSEMKIEPDLRLENDLPSEIYSAKSSYKKKVIGWVVGFIGCWICWILCSRAL